jgi:DNA-binding NarL/FixJ family response regulator
VRTPRVDRSDLVGVATVAVQEALPIHGVGLRRALEQRGLTTSTVAGSAEDVVRHACGSSPRVAVLHDTCHADTLRAIADAGAMRPDLSLVAVGPVTPEVDVLVALASGVAGYLPEQAPPAAVADAVVAVLAGDVVAPPAVTGPLVRSLRTGSRRITVSCADGGIVEVTVREWEVLVLLRQGRSTGEMACRLMVAPVTVRSHVAALVEKFCVADRKELTGARPGPRQPTATAADGAQGSSTN